MSLKWEFAVVIHTHIATGICHEFKLTVYSNKPHDNL